MTRTLLLLALAMVSAGCGEKLCGNGRLDPGEACDGQELNQQTCSTVGFGAGTLGCTSSCQLDKLQCGAPSSCGNGVRDGVETCDGADLAGASCVSVGSGPGTLLCAPNCGGYLSTGCAAPPSCVPQCGARRCGSDPVCGQPCGACDDQSVCTAEGQCKQICDLPPLTHDTTLDVDVRTVTLTGGVMLNGAALPDNTRAAASRASLVFTHKLSSGRVSVPLGPKGPGQYSVMLYPGAYELAIEPGPATEQNVLPPYTHVVRGEVEVQQSGSMDVELKTVTVTGALTLNGAELPNNGVTPRGELRFAPAGRLGITASLGSTGAARYSVTLFAGTYAVSLEPSAMQAALPAYRHALAVAESLTANATRDYDVKTVRVRGAVTRNGAALPNFGGSPATLQFFEQASSGMREVPLGVGSSGSYDVTLYAGIYDVALQPRPSTEQGIFPPAQHRVGQALSFSADTARDFDAKTVQVGGTLTLDGQPFQSDGTLVFRSTLSGAESRIPLAGSGGSYFALLFAGPYDVIFHPGAAGAGSSRLSHQLLAGESFLSDTTRGLDLATVRVRLGLTLNGAPLPYSPREELRVVDRKTWSYLSIPLASAGPFDLTVFKGRYALELFPTDAQGIFPPYGERVAESVDFTAPVTKTVDIKLVDVTGAVTLNGKPLPDNFYSGSRGWIELTSGALNGSARSDLGRAGAGRFSARIFAGGHDLSLAPELASNQNVWPAYLTRLRTGCAPRPPCALSKGNVAGSWQLSTSSLWRNWQVDLGQSGDRLGGAYSYFQLSGALQGGAVRGDSVEIIARPWGCTVTFHGTLLDGCTMTGTLDPVGACGGWPSVPFFGRRSE